MAERIVKDILMKRIDACLLQGVHNLSIYYKGVFYVFFFFFLYENLDGAQLLGHPVHEAIKYRQYLHGTHFTLAST